MQIKKDEIQLHFIVGMPRSGTTWLGTCLGLHPEVAVFGETNFWGRHHIDPKDGSYYKDVSELQKILRIQQERTWAKTTGDTSGLLHYLERDTYTEIITSVLEGTRLPVKPGDLFRQMGAGIANHTQKRMVFEKTPHHLNWIHRISYELPQSKFIILIRDPYGFVLSMKHMKSFSGWDYYLIRHPLILSLWWKKYIKSYETIIQHYNDRVLCFRLDEIKAAPEKVFEKIYAYFGISQTEVSFKQVNKNSSFENSDRPKLRGSEIFWINIILRKYMERHNFSMKPTPLNVFEIIFSFLILPLSIGAMAFKAISYLHDSGGRYFRNWLK